MSERQNRLCNERGQDRRWKIYLMQKIIADIITETCGITCWVYVEIYVHRKSLKEMLEERKKADKFILVIDTWFEKFLRA